MWFGTNNGVIRYDGKNSIHYSHEDGLSDYSVIRMQKDKSGRLWLFNLNGTVNYIYRNTVYNEKNAPFLDEIKSKDFIRNFYEDTSDSLLYFYNLASEVFVVKDDQLYDYRNFGLNNKEDKILFQLRKTKNKKLELWSAKGIYETNTFDGILDLQTSLNQAQKTFITNTNETVVLDKHRYLNFYDGNKLLRKSQIQCVSPHVNSILIDREGYIWVSTFNKGIYCYKDDHLVHHSDIRLAQTLIEDQENNIWTSSLSGGVFKINRNILKYGHLDKNKFNNRGITDIIKSNDGGLWLTNGTSIFKIKKDQLYRSNISVYSKVINQLNQLKNGVLLAKGTSTGLFFIHNIKTDDKLKIVTSENHQRQLYSLSKLSIDKDEKNIYSHVGDELLIIKFTENFNLDHIRIKKGRIQNISINRNDELIVNTSSENYLLKTNSGARKEDYWAQLFPEMSLAPYNGKKMSSHLTIDDKFELFNFEGNKLVLQDSAKVFELLQDEAIQIDHQIKNLFYADSTLFFSTTKTIYYITNPLGVLEYKPITLNRINIDFKSINEIHCNNHKLYVATNEGLTYIPIEDVVHAPIQTPKPYFYQVFLDSEKYNFSSGRIQFKNKRRLSIEFSSLNYSSIPTEYSYQLKGLDEHWINGRETRVVYSNLSPGEYIFQLKTRKNREPYSEIIELPVIVKPTLFQRTSTKLLLILFAIFVIYVIIRMYYRRKIEQKETDHTLITLEHKALQSMMNPHFIFNALGSIQGFLLQNKSSEAGTYLSQFARLIRQNMNSLKSNFICIDEEVERLRNYIDLEKLRMNNRFVYEIIVDEELDSYEACIPSMIVQPFVENAIWHGISSLNDGGKITIVFNSINEKSIEVLVEDNGVGIKESDQLSKPGRGLNMGMTLTKKRLKLIGERQGVLSKVSSKNRFPDSEFPGTQIKIIIPLVNGES